jgi:hypothetical protein
MRDVNLDRYFYSRRPDVGSAPALAGKEKMPLPARFPFQKPTFLVRYERRSPLCHRDSIAESPPA